MSHPISTQDVTEQMYPEDIRMSFDEAVREVFVRDEYDDRLDYVNPFYN